MSKRDFGTIKSLLHFDYPYFAEPNDGLGDEVSSETWTRTGNTKLAGVEIPYEIEGSPKFGYRCAYFPDTTSYITGTNTSEIFNLSPDGEYEFECFVKVTGTYGTILKIGDFELKATAGDRVDLDCVSSWHSGTATDGSLFPLNTWTYVLVRVSGGYMWVYVGRDDYMKSTSIAIGNGATTVEAETIRLGGYVGYMDEFVFRHSAGSGEPSIPSRPYSGTLNVNSIGGFGDGSAGDVTISEVGININSYSMISAVSNERVFTANSWSGSSASKPPVGSEIMIHVTAPKSTATASYPYVGLYAFGHVAEIDDRNITLEEGISIENGYDFTLSSELLNDYYVQVITVPNYESLTVTDEGQTGGQIYAMSWNTSYGGGIVAFRCRSNCTINGSILVHGYGATRYDLQQMTHSKLIDRFLCGSGGGIFITCGGTFTASNNARLGARWDGSGKGGAGRHGNGSNGGAGYGGCGAGNIEDGGTGGSGGVGGGGGGGNSGKGGDAGCSTPRATGGTGGAGFAHSQYSSATTCGGIQGITPGGSSGTRDYINASGGGGAGGDGAGTSWGDPPGLAGASIVLVASRLVAEASAVSTGGAGGHQEQGTASGGGGTGFCYISCGEQVSENA